MLIALFLMCYFLTKNLTLCILNNKTTKLKIYENLGLSMRLLCFLMATSILIVSCDVDRSISPLPVQVPATEDVSYPVLSYDESSNFDTNSKSEFAKMVNEIYAIENIDQQNKVRDIASHVSDVFSSYGVENAVNAEQIEEVLDK